MSKPALNELLNDTGGNFLIGVLGAVVRLAFAREDSFRASLVTFGGGIAFAVLVGYIIKDVEFLHAYSDGIVALCALLGKEVVNYARKKIPKLLFIWLKGYVSTMEEKDNDKPENRDTI